MRARNCMKFTTCVSFCVQGGTTDDEQQDKLFSTLLALPSNQCGHDHKKLHAAALRAPGLIHDNNTSPNHAPRTTKTRHEERRAEQSRATQMRRRTKGAKATHKKARSNARNNTQHTTHTTQHNTTQHNNNNNNTTQHQSRLLVIPHLAVTQ